MKTFNIEATDMGNDQSEIADWVENYLSKIQYEDPSTFDYFTKNNGENLDEMIIPACSALGWQSTPTTGGLILIS